MNVLNLNFPNDTNISITIGSGAAPTTYNFGITGVTGQITGDGTYLTQLNSGIGIQTNRIQVNSGAAPYSGIIQLSNINSFAGAIQKFIISMPISENPTIQFVDDSSNALLIQPPLTGGGSFFAEFEYNNQWELLFWA